MDGGDETHQIIGIASILYESNPDGLGVIAVHRIADDQFLYNRYKREDPVFGEDGEDNLADFLENNDEAWRFIIHARLATHGGTGFAETHPIQTAGCPECDIDFVVHNGVVRNAAETRRGMEQNGHLFTTDVDSEAIAHEYGAVPDSVTDEDFEEPDLNGSLNYLLLQEDRILVRHSRKYEVSERFTMATKQRDWLREDTAEKSGFHLFYPDGSHESDTLRSHRQYRTISTSRSQTAGTQRAMWGGMNRNLRDTSAADDDAEEADDEPEEVVSPGSKMEDFPDAAPGFLTLNHPLNRAWVMRADSSIHDTDLYYCKLHATTFTDECDRCWEEDASIMNGASNQQKDDWWHYGDDEPEESVVVSEPSGNDIREE